MVKLTAVFFVIHLVVLYKNVQLGFTCKISEFSCRNSQLCLPLDRYCDGRDDCGDKSDEPKGCTGELQTNEKKFNLHVNEKLCQQSRQG